MSQAVAWRGRVISFRTLAFIILGLGVVRLIVAFLMPQEPSIMAPDEGTYAGLAGVVGSGGDWAAWSSGWGAGLYPGSRALLGPAALLTYLGLPDLTAVRVVSVLYAVGSQLLLLAIARLARSRITPGRPAGLPLISWPMLGIVAFVLMPSNVLWSNLGLREAACAFWVLAAVTAAAYLLSAKDWRWKLVWGAAIAASITMAFQSRIYLAAALVLALAVGVVWLGKERPRVSVTLAASVVLGTLLGVTASLPVTLPSSASAPAELLAEAEALRSQEQALRRTADEARAAAAAKSAQAQADARALAAVTAARGDVERARELLAGDPDAIAVLASVSDVSNPMAKIERARAKADAEAEVAAQRAQASAARAQVLAAQSESLKAQAAQRPSAGPFTAIQQGVAATPTALNPDTYLERGSYQREVSALYADSAIATDSCSGVPDPRSLRWCEITRLPDAAFAVMFRPLWPLDIPAEWSAMAVLASIENVAWLGLVATVIWVLFTRRFSMTRLLTIGLSYGALVIAGMSALEGNFGTAFRHKSSVLWVLCLVLVVSGARRGPAGIGVEDPEPRPGSIETPA